eukprot:1847127-Pyramimonas_sp.AAC.2
MPVKPYAASRIPFYFVGANVHFARLCVEGDVDRSVSKELEKTGEWGVVYLDLVDDEAFDLTNPALIRIIRGWISSRVVRGVFLAPPCSTWSNASH